MSDYKAFLATGWPWPTWQGGSRTQRMHAFWLKFYKVLNSEDFKSAILHKFRSTIQKRLQNPRLIDGLGERIQFNVDFFFDLPGYAVEPHCDMPTKLVSMLLYFPSKYQTEQVTAGTSIFRPTCTDCKIFPEDAAVRLSMRRNKNYTEVKRVPYKANTMFAFAPCTSSWHGVHSRTVNRRVLFMWLAMIQANDTLKHGTCPYSWD